MTQTQTQPRICHHPKIPEFGAPAELWSAVGATVYENTDEVSVSGVRIGCHHISGAHLLVEAWHRCNDGTAALLWFLSERARREREADECRAVNNMASAIKSTGAIMRYNVELALAKLPPSLRDRVRQLAEV